MPVCINSGDSGVHAGPSLHQRSFIYYAVEEIQAAPEYFVPGLENSHLVIYGSLPVKYPIVRGITDY